MILQPLVVLLGGALLMLAVRRLPASAAWQIALRCWCCRSANLQASCPWPQRQPSLGLGAIFLTFLKMGLVVFGSGYVLVAFLGSELVTPGYLTEQELLDAIAIGQLTPGPVFTTATFIGYLLAGVPGAVVATVGIFLPSFVLVGVSHPFLPRLRANETISIAIDGLNAAAVGLIGASIVFLGRDAFLPDGSLRTCWPGRLRSAPSCCCCLVDPARSRYCSAEPSSASSPGRCWSEVRPGWRSRQSATVRPSRPRPTQTASPLPSAAPASDVGGRHGRSRRPARPGRRRRRSRWRP